MKRSVVIKRLDYEASAGWTTYGTSLAAFSLFQGIATCSAPSKKIRFWAILGFIFPRSAHSKLPPKTQCPLKPVDRNT